MKFFRYEKDNGKKEIISVAVLKIKLNTGYVSSLRTNRLEKIMICMTLFVIFDRFVQIV